jgi:UPF0755 protein
MKRKTASRDTPRRRSALGRTIRSLALTGLLLALLAAGAGSFVLHVLERPGQREGDVVFAVPRGASTMEVVRRLEAEGLVPSRWLVLAEVLRQRLTGRWRHVKAGEFRIPADASVREVVEILQSGKAILYKVTIPEGFSVAQVIERLEANPHLSGKITEVPEEGSLLPDTYVFQRGESRQALIRRMQEAQKRLLDELWPKRAPDLPIRTKREAVILASIVEKETALPHERRRVAAVFINRLKKGMRLQADPTIIYGITKGRPLGRPIRKSEIEADHPWNTYRIRGLPPTPIANPGRESIAAVLNPARTDDLYFVADGKGGHIFASTLKAHNENVRKWRRIRRELERRRQARAEAAGNAKSGERGGSTAEKGGEGGMPFMKAAGGTSALVPKPGGGPAFRKGGAEAAGRNAPDPARAVKKAAGHVAGALPAGPPDAGMAGATGRLPARKAPRRKNEGSAAGVVNGVPLPRPRPEGLRRSR